MSSELVNRAHLAGVPTCRSVWRHVAAALDAHHEHQPPQQFVDEILDASVRNPVALAAPRDPAHTREVLTWLAGQWRARGWRVPPEFQIESSPSSDDTPDLFYKTYIGWGGGGKGRPGVTLLESGGGITHNTTGLTTWYGAAVLADWVANNPRVVSGRRVLELGAGVGFSASVILTSPCTGWAAPAAYTATDCHHHVLTLLHHNLAINLAPTPLKSTRLEEFQGRVSRQLARERAEGEGQEEEEELVSWVLPTAATDLATPTLAVVREDGEDGHVGVMQVDWRHPPRLPPVDVVLAADVVYAHHLLQPLVALIRSILEGREDEGEDRAARGHQQRGQRQPSGGSREEDTGGHRQRDSQREEDSRTRSEEKCEHEESRREAFIACTRRTHETLELFLQEVARQGLHYALVYQATLDADTALFVYNEVHLPVRVYKITL